MIRNLDTLEKRFDGIARLDIQRAVAAGIKTVQAEAKARCPTDHGELKNSIFTDVEQDEDKTVGTCYTNKKYAVFVEMGTGPKGQENHSGIAPDANPVYHQDPWWIHESQIDRRVAERSHWFYIDTPQGRFYQCFGQRAQPYMYPALHDNRDRVLKQMADIISGQIRST